MNCSKCGQRKASRRGLCHACYEFRRIRDVAYGRWESTLVDAQPVRDHVLSLIDQGVSRREICRRSGLPRSNLMALLVGRKRYGKPSSKVSATTAQKLMAVEIGTAQKPLGARIDSTGTVRRLRALVAAGYTQSDLAERLGLLPTNATALFNGKREMVLVATAYRVTALFNQLQLAPGPSPNARLRAQRLKWAPPLAWDEDTIDDPDAAPDLGEVRPLSWDEKYLELKDLGLSDTSIAARMGIEMESLHRQLQRYGIAS